MNNAPILILQMQRMGDLALSFPLLTLLSRLFPAHPLWVVGEPAFFEPLMPLSPQAVYFSYEAAPKLAQTPFHAVINISHRTEAAILAGKVQTDSLTGRWRDGEGRLFVNGDWQLYRDSITHNNRYNLYHWSDLNALDDIPPEIMEKGAWPLPRAVSPPAGGKRSGRIGLFLGASEASKHPGPEFWTALTRMLLEKGYRPALLGGEAEKPLGRTVAARLNAPALNLCGRFSMKALTRFFRELSLLVSPDTGPMHVAAWTGTPVLNLSLGPVNPWETGPAFPGHYVARVPVGCAGCWSCTREALLCHEHMKADSVALLVHHLLSGKGDSLPSRSFDGLDVLLTGRGRHGLYTLHGLTQATPPDENNPSPDGPAEPARARLALSRFWQAWFGHEFGRFHRHEVDAAWRKVQDAWPQTARLLVTEATSFAFGLIRAFRNHPANLLNTPDFWKEAHPVLRPLSGYIQTYAQNTRGSRRGFTHALSLAEKIAQQQTAMAFHA